MLGTNNIGVYGAIIVAGANNYHGLDWLTFILKDTLQINI